MGSTTEVDLPDDVIEKKVDKSRDKKPRLKKVPLDREDTNRHGYCMRAIRISSQKFQEEIKELQEAATESELDVKQMQMQIQVEHGMSMQKANEQGKLDQDSLKEYSSREARYVERLKKVNFAMQNSPQKKRMKAWKKLVEDIEEEVSNKLGCNADDIDWEKGVAEVVEGEDYAAMKDEMDAAFEKELERIEAEAEKSAAAQENAA